MIDTIILDSTLSQMTHLFSGAYVGLSD